VFETDGDLPDINPVGAAYGPSIEVDDHALERAMRLHSLSWELRRQALPPGHERSEGRSLRAVPRRASRPETRPQRKPCRIGSGDWSL